MSKQTNDANWYTTTFKAWQAKALGPKPTAEMLATIHNLSARPGKQALASAMALREGGVTAAQIVMACGAPQLNKMRGFITDGLLKREAVPPAANGHTVYKLTVTAKGKKRIETAEKAKAAADAKGAADEPAKPVVKRVRASKPVAKPVDAKPAETAVQPANAADAAQATA